MNWPPEVAFWRERQITDLEVKVLEAGEHIVHALGEKRVDVGGAAAWGQYVDHDFHSPGQWGLMGTAAAIETLALFAIPPSESRHLREALPLPTDRSQYDQRIPPEKMERGRQDIVRMALVAEALEPGRDEFPRADWPPLVEDIIASARAEPYWTDTSLVDGAPQADGSVFTTAFVLHSLRRYEDPAGAFRPQREWLAAQVQRNASLRRQPQLVALTGLALIPVRADPSQPVSVSNAVKTCQDLIREWRSGEKGLKVNRPAFAGYQLGTWTDYTFLNPEVLAAFFLLRSGNPRSTRRFVLAVVREVSSNVEQHRRFEGQLGLAPTVDQLWAGRLLHEFSEIQGDEARRHVLRPRLIATRRTAAWLLIPTVLAGVVALLLLDDPGQVALAATIVFLLSTIINVLVALLFAKD